MPPRNSRAARYGPRFAIQRHRSPAYSSTVRLTVRETIKPFEPLQQSANAAWVPFAAPSGSYLSRIQLARDGAKRDEALYLECTNCRSQCLGSGICGLLVCQPIVDRALGDQAEAPQYLPDAGAMPPTAEGGWYPPSIQFIRQCLLGNEACRHKLSNGRGQSSGAAVCCHMVRSRAGMLRLAGRNPRICLLHCGIMENHSHTARWPCVAKM